MGYLFLALALAAGLTKAFCGKKSSLAVGSTTDAVIITAVRMLLCCVIGFILAFVASGRAPVAEGGVILLSAACGIMSALFTVSWLLAVSTTMYMMVEVFVTGGVIIPLVLSNAVYGERIGIFDVIGVLLLLFGILFISTAEGRVRGSFGIKGIALLILCMISSGATDLLQKVYAKEFPKTDALVFNFYVYTFAAAALILTSLAVVIRKRGGLSSSLSAAGSIWVYVLIMALCLFLNSYFKTRAAAHLDAVVLYPVNQGLAMILSSLMSVFLFKERMKCKAVVGIALTLVGVILINVF